MGIQSRQVIGLMAGIGDHLVLIFSAFIRMAIARLHLIQMLFCIASKAAENENNNVGSWCVANVGVLFFNGEFCVQSKYTFPDILDDP